MLHTFLKRAVGATGECQYNDIEDGELTGQAVIGQYAKHGRDFTFLCNDGYANATTDPICINGTWSHQARCVPGRVPTRSIFFFCVHYLIVS